MTKLTDFQRKISAFLPEIELRFQEPMAKHTSFRIGGEAEVMAFPEWYGNNLDALWDLLSEGVEREIELINSAVMLNALGAYGCRLLQCFFDAAADGGIKFTIE